MAPSDCRRPRFRFGFLFSFRLIRFSSRSATTTITTYSRDDVVRDSFDVRFRGSIHRRGDVRVFLATPPYSVPVSRFSNPTANSRPGAIRLHVRTTFICRSVEWNGGKTSRLSNFRTLKNTTDAVLKSDVLGGVDRRIRLRRKFY